MRDVKSLDEPRWDRNQPLEQEVTALAARAAGFMTDGGLGRYADERCAPYGGVRASLDLDEEARQELADLRNYLVWGLHLSRPGYLKGEPEATQNYERRLRALKDVVSAWHALHDYR